MKPETDRRQTAERLRRALSSEVYGEAQIALGDYRRAIETAVAQGVSPAELAQEADELMQWALRVVRAARAQTHDQLEQISGVLRYRPPAPQVQTWKLDG
jgi:hypothetical protein